MSTSIYNIPLPEYLTRATIIELERKTMVWIPSELSRGRGELWRPDATGGNFERRLASDAHTMRRLTVPKLDTNESCKYCENVRVKYKHSNNISARPSSRNYARFSCKQTRGGNIQSGRIFSGRRRRFRGWNISSSSRVHITMVLSAVWL